MVICRDLWIKQYVLTKFHRKIALNFLNCYAFNFLKLFCSIIVYGSLLQEYDTHLFLSSSPTVNNRVNEASTT